MESLNELVGVIALLVAIASTLFAYLRYRNLVPDFADLPEIGLEKRFYVPNRTASYYRNGEKVPWWMVPFVEIDLRSLAKMRKTKALFYPECFYDRSGVLILSTEEFMNKLTSYEFLVRRIAEKTGGRPERDPRSLTQAPYLYSTLRLKKWSIF